MIQIQHIRKQSFNKGRSIRSIARETGHNFRTIRKYIEQSDFNQPTKKKSGRPSKLDAVKAIIDMWLTEDLKRKAKNRHTARRIYDRLRSEHGDIFNASDRTVRAYVAAKKKELYGINEGFLPLDHPPGEAQVDFGDVIFCEKGQKIEGHELVMSFPFSNGGYAQLLKGENQECLFTGMREIFEHMKTVPTVIWFDNLSAAVAGLNGREVWIKIDAHLVEILDEDYQSIIKHRRLYGKNLESMNWYPYLTTLAKRPNALKYSGFYRELPDPWQDYLDKCDHDGKKSSLKVLLKILEEGDMDTATRSLEECQANGAASSEGILLTYYRLTQESIEESLELPSNLSKLAEYTPDISSYDLLLGEVS